MDPTTDKVNSRIQQVKEFLQCEDKFDNDRISIFRVPQALKALKPEAYTPQLLGLGPYHHFRDDLYELERMKLAAVKGVEKEYKAIEQLVEKLRGEDIELRIRASYHKYLEMEDDALLWLMTIDGIYLLEFLFKHTKQKDSPSSSSSGKNLACQAVISDIMMLENQIPCSILQSILTFRPESFTEAISGDLSRSLDDILIAFCEKISPLKLNKNRIKSQVTCSAHLLDLLYHLILPEAKIESDDYSISMPPYERPDAKIQSSDANTQDQDQTPDAKPANKQICLDLYYKVISSLHIFWVKTFIRPIKVIVKMPWSAFKELPKNFKEGINASQDNQPDGNILNVDEILIPSVSSLVQAGVEICPAHDISNIKFEAKQRKFYLPHISLNVHSQVIIRNLIAYEAGTFPESMVFIRYTEIMSGIIDTAEDAKLLRDKKIIRNFLKSDADVADLFNSIGKSVQLTKVPHIDKAIQEVNKYYYSTTRVRLYQCTSKCVNGSCKILVAVLIVLMMALQSYCSAHDCSRSSNMDKQQIGGNR
ncbi:hypothetical protein NMG60_11017291 [Bertholletia excelsa]